MKRSVIHYSNWLVIAGVMLLGFGIFRTITTTAAAPKDDVIIMGEVVIESSPTPKIEQNIGSTGATDILPTLPAPEVTESPLQSGGYLLPDTNTEGDILEIEEISGIEKNVGKKGSDRTNKIFMEEDQVDEHYEPTQIIIPVLGLDAPIVRAKLLNVKVSGYLFEQWAAPEFSAAGWHPTSALLGEKGNTVLNGHHNDFGEVFRRLIDLREGDTILVLSQTKMFSYTVTNKIILQETGVTLIQRMQNSRWIAPSNDERLTLVTCWPYESNSHRLLIVAVPTPGSGQN